MPIDLEQLKRLSAEWKGLQPLQASRDERLWQKLRLEWNYHSNHIEGNTLTYKETTEYLLRNRTSGVHTIREYEEMKGHDLAIEIVRDLAASSEDITEVAIRNLNNILLKEPFYKEAKTKSGEATRKLITPGRYKEEPNSVLTSAGDIFEYLSPVEVPDRMAKLVEAIRDSTGKEGLDFIAALAITHHEFTRIHPFDDGNGRVARLMINYVLLKKSLPPLVIPSDKKQEYLGALRRADAGDPALLADFLADRLAWSLELGIKAANGESLEELSDVEKEIALFVREQKSHKKQVVEKNYDGVHLLLTKSLPLLFEKFDEKTKRIGELFESRSLTLSSNDRSGIDLWREGLKGLDDSLNGSLPSWIRLDLLMKGYTGKAKHPFQVGQSLLIFLQEYEYRIDSYGLTMHHAIYAEALTEELADKIVNDLLKKLFEQIQQLAGQ